MNCQRFAGSAGVRETVHLKRSVRALLSLCELQVPQFSSAIVAPRRARNRAQPNALETSKCAQIRWSLAADARQMNIIHQPIALVHVVFACLVAEHTLSERLEMIY